MTGYRNSVVSKYPYRYTHHLTKQHEEITTNKCFTSRDLPRFSYRRDVQPHHTSTRLHWSRMNASMMNCLYPLPSHSRHSITPRLIAFAATLHHASRLEFPCYAYLQVLVPKSFCMFRNSPFSLLVYQTTWRTSFNRELSLRFSPLKLSDIRTTESFLRSEYSLRVSVWISIIKSTATTRVSPETDRLSLLERRSILMSWQSRWSYFAIGSGLAGADDKTTASSEDDPKGETVSCNTGFIMSLSHSKNDPSRLGQIGPTVKLLGTRPGVDGWRIYASKPTKDMKKITLQY